MATLESINGYARYSTLPELTQHLETLRQLVLLDSDSCEVFEAQKYIADSLVNPAGFPNLAVDRETLLTTLAPSRLISARSRSRGAISREVEAFKIRFVQTYREHHRRFHDALPEFQAGLLSAQKQSAALKLLNTVDELGPPVGAGLKDELAALATGLLPSSVLETELDLSIEPRCPNCRLSLEQTVPSAELARLVPRVDMALGGKTQELCRRLVEKAMAGRADGRWREFLQIVKASELSSLANTLDSDLGSFKRKVWTSNAPNRRPR